MSCFSRGLDEVGVRKKVGILSPDTQEEFTPASAGSSVTYGTPGLDKQNKGTLVVPMPSARRLTPQATQFRSDVRKRVRRHNPLA